MSTDLERSRSAAADLTSSSARPRVKETDGPPSPVSSVSALRRKQRPLTTALSIDSSSSPTSPGSSANQNHNNNNNDTHTNNNNENKFSVSAKEAAEARSQILNEIKALQIKRHSSFKRILRGKLRGNPDGKMMI
ncbi:hypothetical protein TCAL_14897 [Tigriopus californicus]|uniref:Uncharacterized protein n=1 Tax=Tigriopus californicus TaxID=6832 RepID=A0A553P3L2_TIGCA|nr:hypothetical protein TCAL_14897 [Tigriopus californicus]